MVIDLQRVVLMRVRQLHALHVGNPIGRYINVRVVSSKKNMQLLWLGTLCLWYS